MTNPLWNDAIKFKRVDGRHYEVFACGVSVGFVYYKRDASSQFYRWFVEENINGKVQKLEGYDTRMAAGVQAAVMNSGKVVAKIEADERDRAEVLAYILLRKRG